MLITCFLVMLRDAADVGIDGGFVEESGGEEDGDGEGVAVALKEELAKLHHGDYVAYAWSWIENYVLLHFVCVDDLGLIGRWL